jgi:death on curing protein
VADYRYLNADDVVALAEYFFGRLGYSLPILRGGGRGLLESAVTRAYAAAYYAGADLAGQAAALANGIALSHPFSDGNKRAAWAACAAFPGLNGRPLPVDALVPLARKIIELHETTNRTYADKILSEWLRPYLEAR